MAQPTGTFTLSWLASYLHIFTILCNMLDACAYMHVVYITHILLLYQMTLPHHVYPSIWLFWQLFRLTNFVAYSIAVQSQYIWIFGIRESSYWMEWLQPLVRHRRNKNVTEFCCRSLLSLTQISMLFWLILLHYSKDPEECWMTNSQS